MGEVTATEKMVRRHEYTLNKGTMGTRKGEDLTTTHGSETPGDREKACAHARMPKKSV